MDSFLRTIDDELNDGDDESIFVLQFFRNLIFEKFYARGMCEYSWRMFVRSWRVCIEELNTLPLLLQKFEKWKK